MKNMANKNENIRFVSPWNAFGSVIGGRGGGSLNERNTAIQNSDIHDESMNMENEIEWQKTHLESLSNARTF